MSFFVGYTNSYGAGGTQSYGDGLQDVWLLKTDSNGNEQWNKTFGGPNFDEANSVQQTVDGGYILAGYTGWIPEGFKNSYGTGDSDFWLIKLKAENQPPTAFIDSITPNPAKPGRDTISFIGHGNDSDGSVVAYNWSSSIDGLLNTSPSFTIPASELSIGRSTYHILQRAG